MSVINNTVTLEDLDVMQYAFYTRPFPQSLRFRTTAIFGSLVGLTLYGIARHLLKSKSMNM